MELKRFAASVQAKARMGSGFARSVGILVAGTASAQVVTLAALPIVTRLYSPEDFSVLAVFIAAVTLASVSACLRFEIAIPLPQTDEDASNLLALSLISCSVFGALTMACVVCFHAEISSFIGRPELSPYLWLVPPAAWFVSTYSAFQFWAARRKRFNSIAATRIGQALGGVATQLGFGLLHSGPIGLLLGQTISSGAGILAHLRAALRYDKAAYLAVNRKKMTAMFREYSRFPKYSALEGLTNNAAIQVPVIAIAALAAGPEAGYLVLAMRIMATPIGLLGSAISQVFLSRVAEKIRQGELSPFTAHVVGRTASAGAGPLIFIGTIAPELCPIIFGADWQRAGELVLWMTPWFLMQLLVSPVSVALHATNRQRTALALQVSGLALRLGFVAVAAALPGQKVSEAYAVSGFIFYSFYFWVVVAAAGITGRQFATIISGMLRPMTIWAGAAGMLAWWL